jgi:uncharacterized membrane protein
MSQSAEHGDERPLLGSPASPEGRAARTHDGRSAEFTTAMVHLYRGEIQRSNTWRMRLDSTTNWAVITTGAALSFVLADPGHPSAVLVLTTLLVTLFLWIEARRYRYYELWSHRVRLMEVDYFAAMLVPPPGPRPEWAETLAESLRNPAFPISMWEAFGRRCRRNYIWLFLVLDIAWAIKCLVHSAPLTSWSDFVSCSALGPIPGSATLAVGLVYNVTIFAIAFATVGLSRASGEVLPEFRRVAAIRRFWRR